MPLRGGDSRIKRGTSLVELLIVVSVIAIVSSFVLVSAIGGLRYGKLQGAAYMVASKIAYTQQKAIMADRNCYFRANIGTSEAYVYFDITSMERFELPAGVVFLSSSVNPIYFNYLGTPNMGTTITLGVEGESKRIYVVVAAVTGRVRISDTHP